MRAMCTVPVGPACRVPVHVSYVSWEGPAHESPVGCWVPDQVSSISWEGPDHESPVGCWVPAQVSSISWEGPDHESPMGCWVPVQVSSISWGGLTTRAPWAAGYLVKDVRTVSEATEDIHPVVPNSYTLLVILLSTSTWYSVLDLKDASSVFH